MDTIYINVVRKNESTLTTIESLITVFVYEVCKNENVQLKVQFIQNANENEPLLAFDLTDIKHVVIERAPEIVNYCEWPVITSGNTVVAGLCSVARQIIKSSKNDERLKLLGFREACLMACSESSIWTRFCEIDMVNTVKNCISKTEDLQETLEIPANIARFEYHLEQPCRLHNIYKLARQKNKNKSLPSSLPVEQLNLSHSFGEGPFLTLADVILYPSFTIFFKIYGNDEVKNYLKLTWKWYENLRNLLPQFINYLDLPKVDNFKGITVGDFVKQSLYTADPKRYRPEKRIYTKQPDVEKSLSVVNNKLKLDEVNDFKPYGFEVRFNWGEIPLTASPLGGALPEKRADRKCEQLENLAKAVIKLVAQSEGLRIVDFCSGSGHLGILLAFLFPRCEVILVENKERSLVRAKERINEMKLENVVILQCNLDYFKGGFDIGVALHACGVATDLVLQNCIKNKASFVCCPCCYGGIRDCHQVSYPRSKEFSLLDYKDYLSLAHAADQTHDKDNVKTQQGYVCMDIIDIDRKLNAISFGYDVFLGKLQPTSCTNKNNLLVGVYKNAK